NPLAGSTDRVLDGPTNLVWIDPWLAHLQSRGVDYLFNAKVEQILCEGGRIAGVAVRQDGRRNVVRGDFYLAALPIERIAPMVDDVLLSADPALAGLKTLSTNVAWMNGVQFYLRRPLPTARGHVIHIDTEWALTSISQLQFWRDLGPEQFGDSYVSGVLSVDVSDWTAPGSDGRPAMACSREEAVRETWRQLKRSMNFEQDVLRDEDLHSWFLDPDIAADPARRGLLQNSEPLLVNLVNTWSLRPEAATAIPNLFLASDYVRTHTDLATMEGANEAARRAVNGVLDAARFDGERCAILPLFEPEFLAPWRLHDAQRYKAGLPWDDSLMKVAAHVVGGASPMLARVRPLLEAAAPFIALAADALDRTEDVVAASGERSGAGVAAAAPAPRAPASIDGADDVGPTAFLDRLAWYRDILADTLATAVPRSGPQKHLYEPVREFIARSGKGLRPALCIATTRALGGRTADVLPAAAGIEMLHNAFLVHDDIEDGSEWRRGAPTMHRRAGTPIAVNAGDAMNALGMRLFRRSAERLGPATALKILDEVDHMLVETLEGQATELGWVRDNDLTVGSEDYLRLALKKTAWYSFIHPLRIGALVAKGDDQRLDRFDRFGYLLGLAFQITDDVLNLSGQVSKYGKEIDGDLWEGKRTLLLTYALERAGGADRAWIGDFLARPRERRLPREIFRLHQIIANCGAMEWAQQLADALARAAAREFDGTAFAGAPASPDLDWLKSCVEFLVKRDA
ncbi:MAG TPA: polyprenyl synthetase family protein, partial [Roseiarcus sp.]|nr:polyprenyl synthetase family protein [Roseiarcus sp.]